MWRLKTAAAIGTAFTISLAGVAWYAYSSGKQSGMSQIQSQWDAEVAQMAQAQAEELKKAWQVTSELQAQVDQLQRSHRNEIARINRSHAALVDSLRDRPEARAGVGGVPEDSGAGAGSAGWCTGARLYREHATAFAGESALAAQLQSALRACIAHTTEIERQLNLNSPQ